MAPFRETIRNTVNHMVNVFKQKAQIHYYEGCLKLETNARVFKVCLSRWMSSRQFLIIYEAIH
jgi:hypothetical protein